MIAQKLDLRDEETKPKPVRQVWGAYQEARKELQEAKRRHSDGAISKVEGEAETLRRQQGALTQGEEARHAARNVVETPVEAQPPVEE